MNKILGCKAKDKITGFEGIVTGYVQYLTGCNQALIQPKVTSEGALKEAAWFDEQRLEISSEEPVKLDNGANPGCDMAAPKR